MKQQSPNPVVQLEDVLAEMQRIQRQVGADGQPVSMHEIDALKRLGGEYTALVARLQQQLRGESDQADL